MCLDDVTVDVCLQLREQQEAALSFLNLNRVFVTQRLMCAGQGGSKAPRRHLAETLQELQRGSEINDVILGPGQVEVIIFYLFDLCCSSSRMLGCKEMKEKQQGGWSFFF